MKTSVFEVHDMLSVLSVDEVEKRIGEVPGVQSATVNYAAGSATVRYDETRLEIADIKSAVRQRGFESTAAASPGHSHKGPTAPVTPPSTSTPAEPTAAPITPSSAGAPNAGTDKAATPTTPNPSTAATTAAPAGDEQQDKTPPDKS